MPTVSSETDPISIHALLAESDQTAGLSANDYMISIHALLAESDDPENIRSAGHADFYPRSPCGERRCNQPGNRAILAISIHALLAESDQNQHKMTVKVV